MKTVSGILCIEIYVDCPHCGQPIDLMEMSQLTDEGFIHGKVLSNSGFGCEDMDTIVDCPECNTKFKVKEIQW